ncbi:MAG: DUF4193 family protein [Acidimicrobiia bacterium]
MSETDENEFEDTAEPELDEEELDEGEPVLDTEDLDEDLETSLDELDEEALPADGIVAEVEVVAKVEEKVGAAEEKVGAAEAGDEDEDVVLDLDEELHPDDVEEPLDVLLQERTAKATLEDDEEEVEEEEVDADERGDGPTRIVPRRPGEFLCKSCFLVLPRNQLADEKRMLCRDCV